jgi:beta-fructofuranosidase
MTIALPTKWIWDSWYVRDGDLWHGFFLQADKSLQDPDLRHFKRDPGARHQLGSSELGA